MSLSKEDRIKFIETNIELGKFRIEVLEHIKDVAKEMDGKVLNKKLGDKIQDKLDDIYGEMVCHVFYGNHIYLDDTVDIDLWFHYGKDFKIRNFVNLDITEKFDNFSYNNFYFKEQFNIFNYSIGKSKYCDLSDKGTYRINAKKLIKLLEDTQKTTLDIIQNMQNDLEQVDNMIKDILEINEMMNKYDSKYKNSFVKNVFGCDYELKNLTYYFNSYGDFSNVGTY